MSLFPFHEASKKQLLAGRAKARAQRAVPAAPKHLDLGEQQAIPTPAAERSPILFTLGAPFVSLCVPAQKRVAFIFGWPVLVLHKRRDAHVLYMAERSSPSSLDQQCQAGWDRLRLALPRANSGEVHHGDDETNMHQAWNEMRQWSASKQNRRASSTGNMQT